jgi:hypothetical protein
MKELLRKLTAGILGLLSSRNGTMAIVTLTVTSVLCWFGKIDSFGFSAATSLIVAVYTYTRSKMVFPQ